ncbi:MAG: hypothetical protein H7839_11165 [Magnetococcus sp. YQC-5]
MMQKASTGIVCGVDAWDGAIKTLTINLDSMPDFDLTQLGDLDRIDMIQTSQECTSHTCARDEIGTKYNHFI